MRYEQDFLFHSNLCLYMSNLPAHSSLYAALQEVSDITERLVFLPDRRPELCSSFRLLHCRAFWKSRQHFAKNTKLFGTLYSVLILVLSYFFGTYDMFFYYYQFVSFFTLEYKIILYLTIKKNICRKFQRHVLLANSNSFLSDPILFCHRKGLCQDEENL